MNEAVTVSSSNQSNSGSQPMCVGEIFESTWPKKEELEITFEGRNAESQDFHGIRQLLHELFLSKQIDVSQMSYLLISQVGVGSVLKQSYDDSDDEEDDTINDLEVFGITTVLNLTQHTETSCIQQIYQMINEERKRCGNKGVRAQFKQILESNSKIGFLINERFANIPAQISYPMLSTLQDEVDRMRKTNASYYFDYYIMICKTWIKRSKNHNVIVFTNDEEEFFFKKSDLSFSYSVAETSDTGMIAKLQDADEEWLSHRTVILFESHKFHSIVSDIQKFVLS